MNANERKLAIGFYENELMRNILPFWLERCEDQKNGGYFNCFTNDGKQLISTDKYTWSEGRFLWMFSKMAQMDRPFTAAERKEFLRLAKSGRDFLVKHCFLPDEPLRCVFLMDAEGNPKKVDGYDVYDMSIYADGFVQDGLAQYALAANDAESYEIAKKLYLSIINRFETYNYRTLPYPISEEYVMHGFYMMRVNYSYNIYLASQVFDPDFSAFVLKKLKESMDQVLDLFSEEDGTFREVVYRGGGKVDGIFGNHANPGHICEVLWFILHAADVLGDESYIERCARRLKRTLQIGWDPAYGGLFHFVDSYHGGQPLPGKNDPVNEPIYKQLMSGWGDKLWWVHSEALYAALLFGERTDDDELRAWYQKLFHYIFTVHPNPDREIREWIQILSRDNTPVTKVVALPVKDPYHITRNMMYILRFLYSLEKD